MPVLTTVRQSPAYLYIKTYCLCAIITIFQAAPISSQLPEIRQARITKLKVPAKHPRACAVSKNVPNFISSLEGIRDGSKILFCIHYFAYTDLLKERFPFQGSHHPKTSSKAGFKEP
jgi:hypothetical protein